MSINNSLIWVFFVPALVFFVVRMCPKINIKMPGLKGQLNS